MKNILSVLSILAALSGCASSPKPPPECSGEARKVNPDSISVSAVMCEKESA